MQTDRQFSEAFLRRARGNVVTLHPEKYTPEFCATEAICTLANCIEELQAIFAEHPTAVQNHYSAIGGEGHALAELFGSLRQRPIGEKF